MHQYSENEHLCVVTDSSFPTDIFTVEHIYLFICVVAIKRKSGICWSIHGQV